MIPPRWARTLADWPRTTLADGRDALVVGQRSVTAVALEDGARRWRAEVPRGSGHDVARRGDTVLLATETDFVALERATGRLRWRTASPEPPGPVALVGPDPERQIAVVTTRLGGVVGLDGRTGRPRWSVRLSGRPRGVPTVDHGSGTVVSMWQRDDTGTELRAVDAATGSLRWEQRLPLMAGSPVIAGDLVVVSAGNGHEDSALRAFALDDGAPRWRAPVAAPSQPYLVPLVDGAAVVAVDQEGTVTRVALENGARRWTTPTDALSTGARPVRVRDAIVLWNEAGEVITLDRATGAVRARRRPAGIPTGLVAGRGVVVLAQTLVQGDSLQAFDAGRITAPAPGRR